MAKKNDEAMPKKASVSSELRTLVPKPVMWEIGDTLYEQKPLRIDKLSDVMEEITDIVLSQGSGKLFDQMLDAAQGDTQKTSEQGAMPILIRTMVSIPKRLPKIVSMLLTDAKERDLLERMSARQAVSIIKTFIEQNEIGALIQDFFGLMTSVNLSVTQATEETTAETTAPMAAEAARPSDSETMKETEEG